MENQATFCFDITTRGQGQEAWDHMLKLEGNCVLKLIGLAHKRAGLRRGHGTEAEGASGAALRLALGNTSNACYMNSFVQAVAWSADDGATVRYDLLRRSSQFFRHLRGRPRKDHVFLAPDLTWRSLVHGWKEDHRQHDVVEFTQFFCQLHKLDLVKGEWEARTNLGAGQPTDMGSCTQPLLLHLVADPPGLAPTTRVQSLVDAWHVQQEVHALTAAPPALMLQLGRFHNVRGRIHKLHEELWIPFFTGADRHTQSSTDVRLSYVIMVCTLVLDAIRRYFTLTKGSGSAMIAVSRDNAPLYHSDSLKIAIFILHTL